MCEYGGMTNTPDTDPPEHLTSTVELTAPVKPGWKTTEFWLKIAAFALTALFSSGAIPTTGPVATVTAIAATMLGALGYTVSRTLVKNASVILFLFALGVAANMIACGATSKAAGKTALADAVDCTAPDRAALEAQFGPTVEAALQRAIGLDGNIDLPSLNQIGASLEADGWCVLEREAARLIAWTATKIPAGAIARVDATTASLNAQDLRAKLGALRAAKFPGVRFEVGAVQ